MEEITVSEAKEKICPLNKDKCIVDKCLKWEFTKVRNIHIYQPDNACKCGEMTMAYKLCWSCGEVATPERKINGRKEWDYGELEEDKKMGICTLLLKN